MVKNTDWLAVVGMLLLASPPALGAEPCDPKDVKRGFLDRLFGSSDEPRPPTQSKSPFPDQPIDPELLASEARQFEKLKRPLTRFDSGQSDLEFRIPQDQVDAANKQLDRDALEKSYFILPDNDGEARRAVEILQAVKAPYFHVSRQGWGATLDKEKLPNLIKLKEKGVKRVVVFEIPGPELEKQARQAGIEVIHIDHHKYRDVDRTRPESSLEQLMSFINWPMSKTDEALAVNDRGYIPGLKSLGLSLEDIRSIRKYDMVAQGRTSAQVDAEVREAQQVIPRLKTRDGVFILDDRAVGGIENAVKQELAIQSPDGLVSSITVSGGKIGFSGSPAVVKKLLAFDFKTLGYPEGKYAQYGGGDPNASMFFGFKPEARPRGSMGWGLVSDDVMDTVWGIVKDANIPQPKLGKAVPVVNRATASVSPLNPAKGEISYKVYGEGNPETLVLIHGLDSAGATFTPVIEELAKKYRVLIYDQRGHGQSAMVGTDYSNNVMAADLKALLDHLGYDRVSLLGHSMGARTAARFAEQNPDRVQAIIIEDMEMVARGKFDPAKAKKINDQADEVDRKFANKEFPSRRALIKALEPYYGDEAESLSHRRARENPDGSMTLLFNPGVTARYGYGANTEDLTQGLASSQKPVLFLAADPKRGNAFTKEGMNAAMRTPGARVEVIKDAAHNIHGTQPRAFLDQVISFLGQHSAKGKSLMNTAATGVVRDAEVQKAGLMPRGSAVLTSSGKLEKDGIRHIIHAASGSMVLNGPQFNPSLDGVTLSVANSIRLAEQNGHKRVALPFIGGKIFVERIGIPPQQLVDQIVETAVKSRGSIELRFMTFGEVDTEMFRKAVSRYAASLPKGTVEVIPESITDFKAHGASAIVNAANMEVRFGGGVSGVIAKATGKADEIDREAQEAIRKFYQSNP